MSEESLPLSFLETGGPWEECRLPKDVLPQHYYLFIHPDLVEGTYNGNIVIDVKVCEPTMYILLHQTNLSIKATKLLKNDREIPIETTFAYTKNHYWVIKLASLLEEGLYVLSLSFKGKLGTGTLGLYKSTYVNANNEESICMLSYFEATYARCAFPCFDEPSFRAKFAIKIAYETNRKLNALCNTCRDKETLNYPKPGVNTVHFKVTPPMPPYLVALILGEFTYTEPVLTKHKVSVAVYSRPEILNSVVKARDFAAAILDFFTDYFDVPYPLQKLDLIALPNSNIGGMENWGMITFREDLLIINEESTCDDILSAVSTICHEISHMWFGDLVSIEWWDNLWLKEGFATYMSVVSGIQLFPEWYHDWVVLRYMLSALQMDAALGSHPIVQSVNTCAEIREIFDSISYEKGCCLIRMLENLSPEGFRLGVKSYLEKYKYKSAVTQNLWQEIEENVSFKVTSFIDTWTHQMGFPVITIDHCVGEKLTVSQSRFLLSKHFVYDADTSPYKYKWDVPLRYISSDDPTDVKSTWLMKDQHSVILDVPSNVKWVKLNWHQVGFYRTNYPLNLWEVFSNQLVRNPLVLDVEDRVSLIDDAFNLACAGHFYYHIPLSLIRYFHFGKEKHFYPWAVSSNYLRFIATRLTGTDCHSLFMKYVHLLLKRNLLDDIWDFGESKTFLEKKLQLELIKLACWADEQATLQKVKTLFTNWLSSGEPLHPELSQIVYSYGLSGDITEEEWEKVLQRCLRERSVKEKWNLWRSLGNVKNREHLTKLIELAKDENHLKSQDFFFVLKSIAKQPYGLEVVWNFIRNEWLYLVDRFTLEDMGLCDLVFQVCSQFGTKEKLDETRKFFEAEESDENNFTEVQHRVLELIEVNNEWSQLFLHDIELWIEEYVATQTINLEHESKKPNLLDSSSV
ncbi:aminopeptidase A isoform X2 [Halyomorpha halys]|nr:glutamyl aminopeptidase-like isoform X2 [Halyomorpha halys]